MKSKLDITVLGGDLRSVFLSEGLKKDGCTVYSYGLDKVDLTSNKYSPEYCISNSDFVVLGIPVSRNNKSLNAPLSNSEIPIDGNLKKMLENKKVFCGVVEKLYGACEAFKELDIFDYAKDEEFNIKNAVLTADGAISLAINSYKTYFHGANCLVCGYGRIGKILAFKLKLLGANVTVFARKRLARVWAEAYGFKTVDKDKLSTAVKCDVIFNTIPALILDGELLDKVDKSTLIIDLASAPGGIDFNTAKQKGITAVPALGLPSKYAPKEAAEIIKTVIYKEIRGGGDDDI